MPSDTIEIEYDGDRYSVHVRTQGRLFQITTHRIVEVLSTDYFVNRQQVSFVPGEDTFDVAEGLIEGTLDPDDYVSPLDTELDTVTTDIEERFEEGGGGPPA